MNTCSIGKKFTCAIKKQKLSKMVLLTKWALI